MAQYSTGQTGKLACHPESMDKSCSHCPVIGWTPHHQTNSDISVNCVSLKRRLHIYLFNFVFVVYWPLTPIVIGFNGF